MYSIRFSGIKPAIAIPARSKPPNRLIRAVAFAFPNHPFTALLLPYLLPSFLHIAPQIEETSLQSLPFQCQTHQPKTDMISRHHIAKTGTLLVHVRCGVADAEGERAEGYTWVVPNPTVLWRGVRVRVCAVEWCWDGRSADAANGIAGWGGSISELAVIALWVGRSVKARHRSLRSIYRRVSLLVR